MEGYYNRAVYISSEGQKLRLPQKVIITTLDESITLKPLKLQTLEENVTVYFAYDWNINDKELYK